LPLRLRQPIIKTVFYYNSHIFDISISIGRELDNKIGEQPVFSQGSASRSSVAGEKTPAAEQELRDSIG
jgi:hypothetical protein